MSFFSLCTSFKKNTIKFWLAPLMHLKAPSGDTFNIKEDTVGLRLREVFQTQKSLRQKHSVTRDSTGFGDVSGHKSWTGRRGSSTELVSIILGWIYLLRGGWKPLKDIAFTSGGKNQSCLYMLRARLVFLLLVLAGLCHSLPVPQATSTLQFYSVWH